MSPIFFTVLGYMLVGAAVVYFFCFRKAPSQRDGVDVVMPNVKEASCDSRWCEAVEEITSSNVFAVGDSMRIFAAGKGTRRFFQGKIAEDVIGRHLVDVFDGESVARFTQGVSRTKRDGSCIWKTEIDGFVYGVCASKLGDDSILVLLKEAK